MDRLPEKIEAEGLLLRRWTPADAEALGRAVEENVEHLRPWMRWAAEEPRSVQGRRALLTTWEREWEGGGDAYLGIFLDGAVAGSAGFRFAGERLDEPEAPAEVGIDCTWRLDAARARGC